MQDYIWFIAVLLIVVIFLVKRLKMIGREDAQKLIQQGGKVIDVRTPGEFAGRHCAGAVNIPLSSIEDRIEREVKDKGKPVLLYCLSGSRSGSALRILRQKGYTNVHNLGSLGRAERILKK